MSGKELVKRLRDAAFLAFDDGTNDYGTPVESADRIEALTAKVKLMDDLDVINGEKIEALTEQLKTVLDREAATTARYDAKTDELEAKLAKAVEALEPFARAAETWEPDDGDSGLGARIEHPHHGLERHAEFTFGDLRRARATLAEIKGESHE
jgi:hypothetical protein